MKAALCEISIGTRLHPPLTIFFPVLIGHNDDRKLLQSGLRPSLRPAPVGNYTGPHSCRSTGQDNCRRPVYGGKLLVKDGNVQVDGIPRSACIQVSWKLIKTGMLSINGLVAQRVTGTSISKQCDSTNANVLAWSPYQANEKAEEE